MKMTRTNKLKRTVDRSALTSGEQVVLERLSRKLNAKRKHVALAVTAK